MGREPGDLNGSRGTNCGAWGQSGVMVYRLFLKLLVLLCDRQATAGYVGRTAEGGNLLCNDCCIKEEGEIRALHSGNCP